MQPTKGKILIVEDDVFLLESIRDILEFAGYNVITATNGQLGIEALRGEQTPPDLIVSDIMMPMMDGYQFLNAVRAELDWIDVPFIFLTAKGERVDANFGKELGADDYITKPYLPDDLLVAISSKLRRHRQLKLRRDQQIGQTKRNLLTLIHHEFRTPLTYVVAYNDLLKGSVEDIQDIEGLRLYLSGIDKGAKRLRRLVEDFILLVELETGEARESYKLHGTPLNDYNILIKPLKEEFGESFEEHKRPTQPLQTNIADNIPPIFGYTQYLRKAIECLLDNAIKFGPRDNDIQLDIRSDDDGHILFSVSDRGRGIPPNEIDQIFEPFYQIDRQQNEDQGAGAGLTIVKGVAELHGGEIRVESSEGEGSVFTLVLPAYNGASSKH